MNIAAYLIEENMSKFKAIAIHKLSETIDWSVDADTALKVANASDDIQFLNADVNKKFNELLDGLDTHNKETLEMLLNTEIENSGLKSKWFIACVIKTFLGRGAKIYTKFNKSYNEKAFTIKINYDILIKINSASYNGFYDINMDSNKIAESTLVEVNKDLDLENYLPFELSITEFIKRYTPVEDTATTLVRILEYANMLEEDDTDF